MDLEGDGLAGLVDLFGGLSREELRSAVEELAFRRGIEVDDEAVDEAVDDAVDRFYLVPMDGRVVPGPAAFPTVPDGAEDLPHIMDVERRSVDRAAAAAAAEERFREVAADAIEDAGEDRLRELLDVSYELEAWGPVDVADARESIDQALPE